MRAAGGSQSFFVFGSGRNGSTLFNRMLNQHSKLFAPAEQYFLGPLIARFKLCNYLPWPVLMDLLRRYLMTRKLHDWSFLEGLDWQAVRQWGAADRSLQRLIGVLYQQENQHQKQHWGDTTHLNYHYLTEIYSTFPDSTYIFMIRDGRAVVNSFLHAGPVMGERSYPVIAARQWVKTIESYQHLAGLTDVHLLRYEELVTHPMEELQKVCARLGVDYEPAMLHFHEKVPKVAAYRLPIHQGIYQPVFQDSLTKWEDELPLSVIREVEPIMREGLKTMGY